MFRNGIRMLRDSWGRSSIPIRCYWVAILVFAIGMMNSYISKSYEIGLLSTTSFLLFSIGFMFWIWPIASWMWKSPARKIVSIIFHTLVLVLAVGCAGIVVSDTLGLPSKDFPTTVSLLSVWFYPLVWVMVVALSIFPVAILFAVSMLVLFISKLPLINDFFLFLANRYVRTSRFWKFVKYDRDTVILSSMGNFIGSIILVTFVAQVWEENFNVFTSHPMLVKYFVYKLDYQNITQYPGIGTGEKVVLHDNGIVSFAHVESNNVKIRIGRFLEGSK